MYPRFLKFFFAISALLSSVNGWALTCEDLIARLASAGVDAVAPIAPPVVAEVRQGIFGPVLVRELKHRFTLLFRTQANAPLNDHEYYDMIDGLFSLQPGAFQHAISRLFQSDFDTNLGLRNEIHDFLEVNGIAGRAAE